MGDQERVQSRRLSEVVLLALALATLVSVLVLFPSSSASALTPPKADYRFQNTRSTSVWNAPSLKEIGPRDNTFTTATVDGAPRKVLHFPRGNGVKLSPTTSVVPNDTYTILILFELDSVDGFRRIIDFKNATSDNGLYVQNGNLRLFPSPSGTGTPIAANQYVQVALSRDSGGTVAGYVDGVQQFSFTDSSGEAVIDANNALRFFRDNQSGGASTEHSEGSVARIRLYDVALSAGDVGALDRIDPTVFTVNSPEDAFDGNLLDGKCSTSVPQQCTLRAAIQQANATSGNDTINFASNLSRNFITLTGGQLNIDDEPGSGDDLTINGPKLSTRARVLSVTAQNSSRVFQILDDATVAINRLKISDGFASSGSGGGIFNDGDSLKLTNSTVRVSTAAGSGGGIYNAGGILKLVNSTVSDNTSDGSAGILNEGTMTLTNSTVSGNEATFNGGGIFNSGASSVMTLINSTVSNNTAGQGGGGINNSDGTAILRNTIVAGNTANAGPDVFGTFSSQGNNLVWNTSGAVGFGGSDILNKNPLLGPLQDNGGPTDTHALRSRSPAIDHGSKTGCPSTDQRGLSRPRDGDGNGRARCDIGSYEK
jgi:CSLREA domain-containing protein